MRQTSLEEVRKIAKSGEYKLIPVKREIFSDIRTPVETLRALQNVSNHCFLLESVEDSRQWGRYTFLGYDPSMEISCKNHKLSVNAGGKIHMETEHPGIYIKQIIKENTSPRLPGFPTFTGGLVGYFSYEYLHYGEPELKLNEVHDEDFDDVNLMLFDKLICYDNFTQKIILIANVHTEDIETGYNKAVLQLDEMEKQKRMLRDIC